VAVLVRLVLFGLPAERTELLARVAAVALRRRLGDAAARRIESEGLHRTVCDYIAGMTDRYLIEEYARLGN